jgi:hypothetical protein
MVIIYVIDKGFLLFIGLGLVEIISTVKISSRFASDVIRNNMKQVSANGGSVRTFFLTYCVANLYNNHDILHTEYFVVLWPSVSLKGAAKVDYESISIASLLGTWIIQAIQWCYVCVAS